MVYNHLAIYFHFTTVAAHRISGCTQDVGGSVGGAHCE